MYMSMVVVYVHDSTLPNYAIVIHFLGNFLIMLQRHPRSSAPVSGGTNVCRQVKPDSHS